MPELFTWIEGVLKWLTVLPVAATISLLNAVSPVEIAVAMSEVDVTYLKLPNPDMSKWAMCGRFELESTKEIP